MSFGPKISETYTNVNHMYFTYDTLPRGGNKEINTYNIKINFHIIRPEKMNRMNLISIVIEMAVLGETLLITHL